MFLKLVIGTVTTLILLVFGGLAYRKERQRQNSRVLTINTPNGIVEERFVCIGGIDLWIQIRGEDRDNPVMLILHGGPGWSNATFTLPLRSWEKTFTLVQWDHRGTGKTLGRNGKPDRAEMTFEKRVSDAIELTEFLLQHLMKDRVVLLAESMGTITGLALAQQRPDLFSSLVVTDLYVDVRQNEECKHQLTLARLRSEKNTKGITALEQIGSDPTKWDLKAWNVNMAWAFKTNLPTPNLDRSLLFPLVLTSPIYSLKDIFTLLAGFQYSTAEMFEAFRTFDARSLGSDFEVPFFLFQGECDVITLTALAEKYFAEIESPIKEMSLIKNAGHFAAFTQPDQFLSLLNRHVLPLVGDQGLNIMTKSGQPAQIDLR